MSVQQGTVHLSQRPLWRRQQFWRVALPVFAVFAVIAAALIVYQEVYGSNGSPNAKNGWGVTYPTPKKPPTVKLDASIRPLVDKFVDTAVARTDLATAYTISGPAIRQGDTLKKFLTGNIAVIPFDVDAKTTINVMKIDYSYQNRAELQVFINTPGRKVTNSPHTFVVNLLKQDGRWLVNGWVPLWTPPIPTDPGK
jgi:hypothetical protein